MMPMLYKCLDASPEVKERIVDLFAAAEYSLGLCFMAAWNCGFLSLTHLFSGVARKGKHVPHPVRRDTFTNPKMLGCAEGKSVSTTLVHITCQPEIKTAGAAQENKR
jgi:hypothetical protein